MPVQIWLPLLDIQCFKLDPREFAVNLTGLDTKG